MLAAPSTILLCLCIWLVYVGFVGFRRRNAWKFFFHGREMIREQAKALGKTSFALPVFGYGEAMHIVTTEQHWEDLKNSNPDLFSSRLWVKDFLQPRHSLIDQWRDARSDEGMPIIRAIRTMSTNLPRLKPQLLEIFQHDLDSAISSRVKPGEWAGVPLMETLSFMMTRMNCFFILGMETAKDVELIKSGVASTREIAIIGQAVRVMPAPLASFVTWLVKGKGKNKNQKYVRAAMMRLVNQRRAMREEGKAVPDATTVLEHFVDTCPPNWTASHTVRSLNVLFTTTTLALGGVATQFIKDLYYHEGFHSDLKQEVQQSETAPSSGPRKTSLLEGVLMESMRTACGQATAVHRTGVEPFTFSDGYIVPAGESVQFYQAGVHYDEKRYPQPDKFDPTRFQGGLRSVTDIAMDWPFWGVGKNACAGRFFFTYAAKVLASTLLTDYDCKLKHPVVPNFEMGESSVPSGKNVILMKRKNQAEL